MSDAELSGRDALICPLLAADALACACIQHTVGLGVATRSVWQAFFLAEPAGLATVWIAITCNMPPRTRRNGRKMPSKGGSDSSITMLLGGLACIGCLGVIYLVGSQFWSSSLTGAGLVTIDWKQPIQHISRGLSLLTTPANVDVKTVRALVVVGTRPEAIKMAPLVWALSEHGPALGIETTVLSTKQHKDLVSKFLSLFGVTIDVEMDIPDSKDRSLASLTANVVQAAQKVIVEHKPDIVLVQGDTTSAMALAMTAFYNRIPVGHVEAGLRTYDLEQPFPEEMNRQVISRMASLHFTPTKLSACALLAEGAAPDQVVLTGNTVIDTFKWTLSRVLGQAPVGSRGKQHASKASDGAPESSSFVSGVHKHVELAFGANSPLLKLLTEIDGADIDADDTSMGRFTTKSGDRVVLLTVHRRENHGKPLEGICDAVLQLAHERPDVHFVYPVHPNPKVGDTVKPRLGSVPNVHLVDPLEYDALVFLMSKSALVLTDSGGLQEEATYLARPVLVMRRATERLEGVLAGAADLVGTDTQDIIDSVNLVLDNVGGKYDKMAQRTLPYGDGRASIRTVHAMAAFKAEILASGAEASGRPLHEGSLNAPGIGAPTAAAAAMGCPALLQAMSDNAHAAGSKSSSLRASQ